jgi:dephospho-CoA kinase
MILGITGTIGAGKGAVVDYLVKEKGFTHYSARDFLVQEILSRDLPMNRDSMHSVANEVRSRYQASHIIKTLYARAAAAGHDAVIESVRATGEAEFLKENGVMLVAVDADQKLRYERIVKRGSVTDDIDFVTFVMQEKKELQSDDAHGQNLLGVMAMADYRIENDGSMEELHAKVDEVLKALGR